MQGKIKKLKNSNGEYMYPITVDSAIYVDSNKTLETKLQELDQSIATIPSSGVIIANTIQDFYKQSKSGKKIVFVGDSTTDVAPAMYDRFTQFYTNTGGILEGATIVNRGNNGGTLQNHVYGNVKNTIATVIAEQAHLYVYCYGINDIRLGTRTHDLIKADLKTTIDRILNETTGYILLRIPNTFLSVNSNSWIQPIEKAEEYNNQLWEIYQSFKGYSPRLDIIDIPSMIFGRKTLPFHPMMLDVLHPNDYGYRFKADVIAERISGNDQPILYDMDSYDVVMLGSIESISNNKVVFYSGNLDQRVEKGDVIVIGKSYSFTVKNTPYGFGGKWQVMDEHSGDFSKYGVVKVLRKKKAKSISVPIDKKWNEAHIITNGTYATVKKVVDLTSYAFTGTQSVSGGASVFVPTTGALQAIKLDISFGVSADTQPTTQILSNQPISFDEKGEYLTPITTLDLTGNPYLHFRIRAHVKSGVGNRDYSFTDAWVKIGNTIIPIPNTGWYLDTSDNGTGSGSTYQEGVYEPNAILTYKGLIDTLKSLGVIS